MRMLHLLLVVLMDVGQEVARLLEVGLLAHRRVMAACLVVGCGCGGRNVQVAMTR